MPRMTPSDVAKASLFRVGDRVRVRNDGDGAEGATATVGRIYKSGRIRVDLDCGGFRNLPVTCLEKVQ